MKRNKKLIVLAAKNILEKIDTFVNSDDISTVFSDDFLGLQVAIFYMFSKKNDDDLYNICIDIYDNNTGKIMQVCQKIFDIDPQLSILPFYGKYGSGQLAVEFEQNPDSIEKTKKVPSKKLTYFWGEDYTMLLSEPGTQIDPKLFDLDRLSNFCGRPINDFWKSHKGYTSTTPFGKYHFIDNGSKILAIAHLDTVFPDGDPQNYTVTKTGNTINAVNLDDRLGAYIIMDILPKLGVKVDILLTEGEEAGRSTAAFFKANKKYNWMFQFDRAGTDVVTYHYKNADMLNALEKMGFFIGRGSFSDICFMHENFSGINFGVAYYDNHGNNSFMLLDQTLIMIGKFLDFYKKYQHTRFPHENNKRLFSGVYEYYEETEYEIVTPNKEIYYCINCGYETNDKETLIDDLCYECINWLYA